jgi:hypothetical protein
MKQIRDIDWFLRMKIADDVFWLMKEQSGEFLTD